MRSVPGAGGDVPASAARGESPAYDSEMLIPGSSGRISTCHRGTEKLTEWTSPCGKAGPMCVPSIHLKTSKSVSGLWCPHASPCADEPGVVLVIVRMVTLRGSRIMRGQALGKSVRDYGKATLAGDSIIPWARILGHMKRKK